MSKSKNPAKKAISLTEHKIYAAADTGRFLADKLVRIFVQRGLIAGRVHPGLKSNTDAYLDKDGVIHCVEIKVNTTKHHEITGKHDHKNCKKGYKDALGSAMLQRRSDPKHGMVKNFLLHLDLVQDMNGFATSGSEHYSLKEDLESYDIKVKIMKYPETPKLRSLQIG